MIRLAILGSTGSVGLSTLDVAARHPERIDVVALTANRNVAQMLEQCAKWQPRFAVMADLDAAARLAHSVRSRNLRTTVLAGPDGLEQVAAGGESDAVMAAIVGAAGLLPTLAAAKAGKRLLLANKEALVMSGRLFMDAVHAGGAELLPIDSEHNAVFQCMPYLAGAKSTANTCTNAPTLDAVGVSRIVLTASGGPFRNVSSETLRDVTPEQACAHPNWDMGRKISVDSASMMNKGLEVIEACWLFNTEPSRVDVVVHPQSVVHSMVEYLDGSVLAQMGNPDMRTPIAHALAWPGRVQSGVSTLDLISTGRLDFEAIDSGRFPCLDLAYQAASAGGAASATLNAANEVAVEAFLGGQLRFTDICTVVADALDDLQFPEPSTLDEVLAVDSQARSHALESVRRVASRAA